MTPEQFCYWLQGRAELEPSPPTPEQWQAIRDHLALVFHKVTPPVRVPTTSPFPPDIMRWKPLDGAGDFPAPLRSECVC